MKKFIIFTLLFIVLCPYCLVQFKKQFYEHEVYDYLIEEIKYTEEDIQSIECQWYLGGLPNDSVDVMFADEPNVVYIYFVHDKEHIGQFEHYTIYGKILPPEQLKHYTPYDF